MSQFFANNWAWILAVAIGSLGSWLTFKRSKESQGGVLRLIRLLVWGPFAGPVEGYNSKRQGFSRREKYGIALLGLLMLVVLVMALIES